MFDMKDSIICRTVCVEGGSVLWESWLCSKELQHTQQQNYCVTVIQNVHVSQQLVHWLFWWLHMWFSLVFEASTVKQTMALLPRHSVVLVFMKNIIWFLWEARNCVWQLWEMNPFKVGFFSTYIHVLLFLSQLDVSFRQHFLSFPAPAALYSVCLCSNSLVSPFLAMLQACFGLRFWDHQQLWHCIVFNFFPH